MEKSKPHILVVDDDFSVRETVSDILTSEGFEVFESPNASQALEVVEKQSFDCAIIDLRLPDMRGDELLRKISSKIPPEKTIIITGAVTDDLIFEVLKKAEFFLLLKPVDPGHLLSIVRKLTNDF